MSGKIKTPINDRPGDTTGCEARPPKAGLFSSAVQTPARRNSAPPRIRHRLRLEVKRGRVRGEHVADFALDPPDNEVDRRRFSLATSAVIPLSRT